MVRLTLKYRPTTREIREETSLPFRSGGKRTAYVLQSRGDSFECIGYVYQCTFTTRPLSALIDGDVATFFHSQWQTPVALPHYIVIDLGKEFSAFSFKSTNSNRANDRSWKTLNVYGSTGYDPEAFFDGVKFVDGNSVDISKGGATLLASYTDLPGTVSTIYTSEIVQAKAPVRWVWFEVTETTDGIPYFALAELEIYKYTIMSPEDL